MAPNLNGVNEWRALDKLQVDLQLMSKLSIRAV